MKYLKIKDNKGYYWNGKEHVEIDKMNKDDLLMLLNSAEEDGFEMDEYSKDLLGNRAHQVIYESIHNKLKQFLDDKTHFKREADGLYKGAIGEYSVELTDHDEGGEVEDDRKVTSDDDTL